ncbi:putative phage abortive infection protein [Brucella anthropi]|uniref:putative phage abortive infection protein n=1 Tax=Brucella anthropi TaxID=529 RepID=UPI00178C61B2|nr:putative phage abortive infection protein [Brucella anthropi]
MNLLEKFYIKLVIFVRKISFPALILVLFVMGISSTIYVFYNAYMDPKTTIDNGPWGDYVGGTLNPILTFLSFFGVLVSIYLQRLDLSLSRRELERSADALEKQIDSIEAQNFESAFFQMLNTHSAIVNAIDLQDKGSGIETRGRDCFRVFYTRFNKIFRENLSKATNKHSSESIIKLSYFNFWKEHQLELGHYYRFLYNVFRFMDENKASKPYHAKLLRAQLSDQELLLLFYNCISENGRNFVVYAEKYALFDNLPTVRLLDMSHAGMLNSAAFGNNPMHDSKSIRSSFTKS